MGPGSRRRRRLPHSGRLPGREVLYCRFRPDLTTRHATPETRISLQHTTILAIADMSRMLFIGILPADPLAGPPSPAGAASLRPCRRDLRAVRKNRPPPGRKLAQLLYLQSLMRRSPRPPARSIRVTRPACRSIAGQTTVHSAG